MALEVVAPFHARVGARDALELQAVMSGQVLCDDGVGVALDGGDVEALERGGDAGRQERGEDDTRVLPAGERGLERDVRETRHLTDAGTQLVVELVPGRVGAVGRLGPGLEAHPAGLGAHHGVEVEDGDVGPGGLGAERAGDRVEHPAEVLGPRVGQLTAVKRARDEHRAVRDHGHAVALAVVEVLGADEVGGGGGARSVAQVRGEDGEVAVGVLYEVAHGVRGDAVEQTGGDGVLQRNGRILDEPPRVADGEVASPGVPGAAGALGQRGPGVKRGTGGGVVASLVRRHEGEPTRGGGGERVELGGVERGRGDEEEGAAHRVRSNVRWCASASASAHPSGTPR